MELTFLTRSLKPPVSVMAQDQEDYTLAVPDSSPWGACPLLPSGDCSPVNSKSHKWFIYAYPIYRWVITHQLLTGRILWTVDTTKSISRHELWNLLRSPVAHYRQGILKKRLEAAMIIAWGQTCGNIAVSILIALIPEYLWIQYLWISMDIWAWMLQIAMAVCNPWASSERGVRCARAGVGLVTLPDRQSDIGICQGWDKYDHVVMWVKQ
jgi:hypothetical protein